MKRWSKWQLAAVTGLLVAYTIVSLLGRPGFVLTVISDTTGTLLWMICVGVMLWAAWCNEGRTRWFWILLAGGAAMVGANLGAWFFYEVVCGKEPPDPFWADIPLFLQPVPMMAAAVMRPGSRQREQKFHLTTLNFLVLLLWWVCLYMFFVYPNDYILPNKVAFNVYYYALFILEYSVFLAAVGGMALVAQGAWRKIYWQLFYASAFYLLTYTWLNSALGNEEYYSGSLYDVPDYAAICWFILIAVHARNVPSEPLGETERDHGRDVSGILAVLAVLSIPVIGLWGLFFDPQGAQLRPYRLTVAMLSVLLLGICVFLRQMLLTREMRRLLIESKENLNSLQRAQKQLVQKERLAGVGQLVAGVAHELNNPLTAVIGYSDLLLEQSSNDVSRSKLERLGTEARRIKKIIDNLLSFARPQAEGRRATDLAEVVRESLMLCEYQMRKAGINVELDLAADLPRIEVNGGQFKQVFVNLFTNCANALEQAEEKKIRVEGRLESGKVVMRFTDSGPGFKDVSRAFDPFYTTRPVGQGTGLGLSACYGMVKEHNSNIYAENLEPNGAAVTIEVPAGESPDCAVAR
jgi:signal transduction histidine kinase